MSDLRTVTLNDLRGNDTTTGEQSTNTTIRVADPSEIRPTSVKPDPVEQFVNGTLDKVDAALQRKFKEVDQRRDELLQQLAEANEDVNPNTNNEEVESDTLPDESPNSKPEIKKNIVNTMFIDDNDISDDDDDENNDDTKQIEMAKSVIKQKIKPINNVIDLQSFTISNKPISVLSSLKKNLSSKKTISWALPSSNMSIIMDAFSGFEIQKLDPRSSGKGRFDTYREIYGLLYDHTLNENKPGTVEEWVKLIKFFDIEHLYFSAYKASFDGANSLPYSCPHCKNIFMNDTSIDSMIKYRDEKIKEKVEYLLNNPSTPTEYDVELVQVSDEYVIGLREPSIYNIIFENAILDENFTEKYSSLLSILAYVDSIYYINNEEKNLQPIDLKIFPNNTVKTIKNRITRYSQILQSLSSDQFYLFNAYIDAINEKHDMITYVLPEVECPKCKKIIPEQEMGAESLLFTRHQLAGIANTSTN